MQYYHRLEVLNYCVRDGNRCDHFNMFTGKNSDDLFTRLSLFVQNNVVVDLMATIFVVRVELSFDTPYRFISLEMRAVFKENS